MKLMKIYSNRCIMALIILILFSVSSLKAQQQHTDCDLSLRDAYGQYESADFQGCIDLLEPCVESLERGTVFEAYRLLALCYQQLRNEDKLHKSVVGLLKYNPAYKDFPMFDPVEFSRYLELYDVWSGLELGLKVGVSMNTVRLIKPYSVSSRVKGTYLPKAGFQAGLSAEYFIYRNTSLNVEFLYEGLNYARKADDIFGWKQEFNENLNYFSTPVFLRHTFYEPGNWSLAFNLGVHPFYLNNTKSSVLMTNHETGGTVQSTISQQEQRSSVLFATTTGLTLKRRLGGGTVVTNIHFSYTFNNVVDADKRWDNLGFIMNNQYVDSDFSFMPLYFTVGYQLPVPGMHVVKKR